MGRGKSESPRSILLSKRNFNPVIPLGDAMQEVSMNSLYFYVEDQDLDYAVTREPTGPDYKLQINYNKLVRKIIDSLERLAKVQKEEYAEFLADCELPDERSRLIAFSEGDRGFVPMEPKLIRTVENIKPEDIESIAEGIESENIFSSKDIEITVDMYSKARLHISYPVNKRINSFVVEYLRTQLF